MRPPMGGPNGSLLQSAQTAMGPEAPVVNGTATLNDDDMPLAQRLILLQKKRAAEKAGVAPVVAADADAWVEERKRKKGEPKKPAAPRIKEDPQAPPAAPTLSSRSSEAGTYRNPYLSEALRLDPTPSSSAKVKAKAKPDTTVGRKRTLGEATKAKPDKARHEAAGKKSKDDAERNTEEGQNDDDEEEENKGEYRWWEEANNDGSIKWTSLEHNGLYFPPPYQPHGVPLLYDDREIHLEPEAEEVATFFAAILDTDHYENETFRRNFFEDFLQVLDSINSKWKDVIRDFERCSFERIAAHLAREREARKNLSKEEKERLKAEKARIDDFYGWCLLDGRKEKVGNFRVEPPGLFRGRGKHPKAGKLKKRVFPEEVTLNIGEGARIPDPPPGHSWGRITHDRTVTWLAQWVPNISKDAKYVFLAAGSSLKGQSDFRKFETARKLAGYVDKIREVNQEELRSKEMAVRQRATALWLIDRLALRAGNEKGEDEADTVGCCSLRCEHVKLEEPNTVIFDFLGKDSIRYYNEVSVDPIIFKNLKIFMRPPKGREDPIFDRLQTASLNKYLGSLMPGLSAKVFRTYNASHTFQKELAKTPAEGSIPELVLAYNRANREVAVLCNHQRSIPKTHQQAMERLNERIVTMKYERHLVRREMRSIVSMEDLRKECPAAMEEESDMDEETVRRKEREAHEALKAKEEKGASPRKKAAPTKDRLLKQFERLTQRIEAAKNQRTDRDENKATALGTSKTNYIDPRITTAWCRQHKVPIEKLFNRTLREKFKWAMEVDADWRF